MPAKMLFGVFVIACAFALASCGGGHGKSVRSDVITQIPAQNDSGDTTAPDNGGGDEAESSGPIPDISQLDRLTNPRQITEALRLVSLGSDALDGGLTGTNGTSPDNITSSGTELTLRAFAAGEYSYAIYAQSISAALKPQKTQVTCHASTTGALDETPLPLSYYMGFADYTVNAWRWFGPFSEDMAQAEVNTETLQSSFISPSGVYYVCILAVPDSKAASSLPEDGIVGPYPIKAGERATSQTTTTPGGVTIQEVETWTSDDVATMPAMVTGLKAEDAYDNVQLSWDANSDPNVDFYEVYWDNLDDADPPEILNSVNAPDTEFLAGGRAGENIRFLVRAHSPSGYGGFTYVDTAIPVHVRNFYVSKNLEDKIHLDWDGNLGILSFELFHATSSDGTPELIAQFDALGDEYDDTTVPVDKDQYYWLKAYGEDGHSAMVGPVAGIRFLNPLKWWRTWGLTPTNYNIGDCIAVDGGGNVFTAGYMDAGGTHGDDSVLLKYNPIGTIQWVKAWGGAGTEIAHGIALDTDGNVYLVGRTGSYGAGNLDVFLLKYDTNGNLLWHKTWGGTMSDIGYGIALDADGFIYVTGETRSFGAGLSDALLLKYDPDLLLVWAMAWGGTEDDSGRDVATQNGNLYVGGGTMSFGSGNRDFALIKLDIDGNVAWDKAWGGERDEVCYSLALDTFENIVMTGSDPYMTATGIYTVKFDSEGGLVFQVVNGGGYQAWGVCVDDASNSYVTASTIWETLFFKYGPDGTSLSQKMFSGSLLDTGGGITMSPSGALYSCGFLYYSNPTAFSLYDASEFTPNAFEATPAGTITILAGTESTPGDIGYIPVNYSQGGRGMLTMSLDPTKM
jgi:hypothetical protein